MRTTMATENNNKTLNVPNLRFPEFSGEWIHCALGDISDVTKLAGFEFTQYVTYEDSGSIIALRGLNCKNGRLDLSDVKYIDNSNLSKLTRSKLYIGDILFTYVGTVGEVAIIEENDRYYLAPNVSRIRLNNGYNPYFVKQLLHTNRFYNKIIFPLIATSSQPALSMENVRKFALQIPSISEQQKISSFLALLDERIATQIKIIEDLKKLKSAIRAKVFKQLESSCEFWSEIGNMLQYEQPSKYLVTSTEYSDSYATPVLTANKAFILGYTDEEFGIYSKGECVIFDDFTMDVKYVNFPFKVKSSAIKILTSNSGNDLYFVYEYLQNLGLVSEEHKRHYISEIEPMVVACPTFEEQQNISNLLRSFDSKIECANRELTLYNKQKKHLLSQMFI